MTKKEKIIKLFNEAEWTQGGSGRFKTITYNDFHREGLSPHWEHGEKYCDVVYARSVLNKLGYKVLIAHCFHVRERVQQDTK